MFCFNADKFGWPKVMLLFPGLALTFLSLLAGGSSVTILVVIVIMSLGEKILHSSLLHWTFPFSGTLSPTWMRTYSVHKVNLTDIKVNAAWLSETYAEVFCSWTFRASEMWCWVIGEWILTFQRIVVPSFKMLWTAYPPQHSVTSQKTCLQIYCCGNVHFRLLIRENKVWLNLRTLF